MPVTRKPRGAPNEWGSARDELLKEWSVDNRKTFASEAGMRLQSCAGYFGLRVLKQAAVGCCEEAAEAARAARDRSLSGRPELLLFGLPVFTVSFSGTPPPFDCVPVCASVAAPSPPSISRPRSRFSCTSVAAVPLSAMLPPRDAGRGSPLP